MFHGKYLWSNIVFMLFGEASLSRPIRMKTTLAKVSYCSQSFATLYAQKWMKILNCPEQLLSHPDLGFQGILLCTYLKCVTCTHQEKFGFNTMWYLDDEKDSKTIILIKGSTAVWNFFSSSYGVRMEYRK